MQSNCVVFPYVVRTYHVILMLLRIRVLGTWKNVVIQSTSQWQTKKHDNYKVTFMRNLNVPKNVILMSLKMCCCDKSIDNVVVTE